MATLTVTYSGHCIHHVLMECQIINMHGFSCAGNAIYRYSLWGAQDLTSIQDALKDEHRHSKRELGTDPGTPPAVRVGT